MPIQDLSRFSPHSHRKASTVYGVFLLMLPDFESRHGISWKTIFPTFPVVGQWHFSTLLLISTFMINRFGLDFINPLTNCCSNSNRGKLSIALCRLAEISVSDNRKYFITEELNQIILALQWVSPKPSMKIFLFGYGRNPNRKDLKCAICSKLDDLRILGNDKWRNSTVNGCQDNSIIYGLTNICGLVLHPLKQGWSSVNHHNREGNDTKVRGLHSLKAPSPIHNNRLPRSVLTDVRLTHP